MMVTEAAYVAGIIDGEGTICLNRTSAQGENGFAARLTIANTSVLLLETITGMVGTGSVVGRRERERRRTGYTWVCPVGDIQRVLENVLPFLVLKKEHAVLLLEYINLRSEARR